MKFNPLTSEEERVILHKWTERAFTGEYTDNFQTWTYICRRCNAPLYVSNQKFHSNCGWPSFDDAIPWAVKMTLDEDGRRTEITCNNCGGHLGHVFTWEKLTDKNVRHCVNSISMKFIEWSVPHQQFQQAVFGWGCFWCIEAVFQRLKGVVEVRSWYAWGETQYPSYEQIGRGNTGHIEVVQVFYNEKVISYKQLLEVFFLSHDPTSLDKQWNDVGHQYASAIFYNSASQKDATLELITQLTANGVYKDTIKTLILPLEKFWIAEDYHQNYYNQYSERPYCSYVINPKLSKLRETYQSLLKEEYQNN